MRMGLADKAFKSHALALSMRRDIVGDAYRTTTSLHKVTQYTHERGDNQGAE